MVVWRECDGSDVVNVFLEVLNGIDVLSVQSSFVLC